jgi:Protein of unknown function (DUF3738)
MVRIAFCLGILFASCECGNSQPPERPAFDIASFKLSPELRGPTRIKVSPDSLSVSAELGPCIRWAYQLRRYQIAGPASKNPEDSKPPKSNPDSFEFPHTTMEGLAQLLSDFGAVDLPVVDRTGLTGQFDIVLRFADGRRPHTRPDPNW